VSTVKAEGISNLIFEIPLVGEVYQLGVINREKKGWRIYPNLLNTVDLDALSPGLSDHWRHMVGHGVGQHEL
jgi:hypothetical protein